jgi:hypothetical protein
MQKQMDALTLNETWEEKELHTLPAGAKVLLGKWVYVEKKKENEEKIQKAR